MEISIICHVGAFAPTAFKYIKGLLQNDYAGRWGQGPYNMWYLTMLMPQDIVGGAVLCAPVRSFATAS